MFINNSNTAEIDLADDDLHLKENGKCVIS